MLTVGELKLALEDIPDTALVYVCSDHGQVEEQACDEIAVCTEEYKEYPYYGKDMHFMYVDADKTKATAILIGY